MIFCYHENLPKILYISRDVVHKESIFEINILSLKVHVTLTDGIFHKT